MDDSQEQWEQEEEAERAHEDVSRMGTGKNRRTGDQNKCQEKGKKHVEKSGSFSIGS